MSENLLQRIRAILAQLDSDPLARQGTPHVHLSKGTAYDSVSQRLRGAIEIILITRQGEEKLLHSRSLDGVFSEDDFEDLLADVLSRILMNHSNWPR